ncbi:MAG: hypothetical protein NTY38_12610 [Acidobacteria bacterium]|nr:hypothetical protein [Acidobacteriota bacterium]
MSRAIFLLLTLPALAAAQFTFFDPPGSYTVEVSLDNAPVLRLPIDRNAITSLEVVADYAIGGTAARPGLSPILFAVSLPRRKLERVLDLATVIPNQQALPTGFARGANGELYAGTLPGGHLIRVRLTADSIAVDDLGTPAPGEGILAIAANPKTRTLYGITHPTGKFFTYDLDSRQSTLYDQTTFSRRERGILREYSLQPSDILSRRLILDQKGRVYGSKPVNKLFRFDPEAKSIEILQDELPEGWGRRALGRVDAWAAAPNGTLYGGSAAEGQLFRLDPATGRVTNLGKPAQMPRLKGLAFAADGKLYGVAGGSPGYAHLFSYDPNGRGFTDLGNPNFEMKAPGLEQGIAWRGYQFATVAVTEDGRNILLGEEESLSQLMVFPVK